VASFKSQQVAQNEVDRIKMKEYSAFIEKTNIPNRGVWYRVKVSGFKSIEDAQNFQSKYNKGEI
jgi:cell division septation protein DedD